MWQKYNLWVGSEFLPQRQRGKVPTFYMAQVQVFPNHFLKNNHILHILGYTHMIWKDYDHNSKT